MKTKDSALFSSKSDEWATPQELYDKLDAEFDFNLDPCASDINHKCDTYYTAEIDGLQQKWGGVQSILQSTLQQYSKVG